MPKFQIVQSYRNTEYMIIEADDDADARSKYDEWCKTGEIEGHPYVEMDSFEYVDGSTRLETIERLYTAEEKAEMEWEEMKKELASELS